MTTLEVVEAVQRSLENEGFLQLIRAQLRSNVLRIISSGPEYTPQTGKAVSLAQTNHGIIALQLIRDLMEQYDFHESLSVFEAEAGLEGQVSFDRQTLLDDLKISDHTGCLLENLVANALHSEKRAVLPQYTPESPVLSPVKVQPTMLTASNTENRSNQSDVEEDSVPEEVDEESLEEEDDVNYSQIEEPVEVHADSALSSAASSPIKIHSAPSNDFSDHKISSLHNSDTKQQAPPTLHDTFHNQSKLDESSSFEADSPARPTPSANKNNVNNFAQQKFVATPLDESFVEEPEEEISRSESDDEEDGAKATGAASGNNNPDANDSADNHSHRSSKSRESQPEVDEGPEYDESESDRSADARSDAAGQKSPRSPSPSTNKYGDSDGCKSSDAKASSDGRKASGPDSPQESLRAAVADDFDPTDHLGASSGDGFASGTSARSRIAVRRAASEAADKKGSPEDLPGSKANVNRLGQSSISRSRLGWDSSSSNNNQDRSGEDSDDEKPADTRAGVLAGRGEARYSSSNQMEAVSFDSSQDESTPHKPSPTSRDAPPRRSNNQESEDEASAHGSEHSDEFEVEDGGDRSDISFGEDDGALPLAGTDRAFVTSSVAFSSPANDKGAVDEGGEEEEEYADDDFVEDEEQNDHDESSESEGSEKAHSSEGESRPVHQAAPAFTARTIPPGHHVQDNAFSRNNKADVSADEAEEVESVEEDIDEEDDMSVGAEDSDSDGGFGSPGDKSKSQGSTAGGSMFRAGRSGALPGVAPTNDKGPVRASNFDSILNSFEADSDDGEGGDASAYLPSSKASAASARGSAANSKSSITDRMREIDSQLETLEQSDPHLAHLKGSEDEDSVASEDIDAMEFSTGGGPENDSESSGEGSFSFLDSSTKK